MYLPDRGGGDRRLLEAEERLLERQTELGFDGGPRLCEREGTDVVL